MTKAQAPSAAAPATSPPTDRHDRHDRRISLGVLCGALAGAAWGVVFLAPALVRDFTPWQLSAGRYVGYGLIAAVLALPRWRRITAFIGAREWRALVGLSLLGNLVYYVLLAFAVQWGGIAMTSLIIGFLPVAVTVIGSRRAGAVPLVRLLPSLTLGAAGIGCVSWDALQVSAADASGHGFFGFLCALGALASWTSYAVLNARWLESLKRVSSHDWSLLTGLVTGALALLLAIPAFAFADLSGHDGEAWLRYGLVCGLMALLASVVGNAFWNRASRLLPLTLVGQMVLFETLFALLYGFLWEARGPSRLEIVALVLVVSSVLACVRVHRPALDPRSEP